MIVQDPGHGAWNKLVSLFSDQKAVKKSSVASQKAFSRPIGVFTGLFELIHCSQEQKHFQTIFILFESRAQEANCAAMFSRHTMKIQNRNKGNARGIGSRALASLSACSRKNVS